MKQNKSLIADSLIVKLDCNYPILPMLPASFFLTIVIKGISEPSAELSGFFEDCLKINLGVFNEYSLWLYRKSLSRVVYL